MRAHLLLHFPLQMMAHLPIHVWESKPDLPLFIKFELRHFYVVLIFLEIWMSPCGIGRVQSDSEGGLRLGFKVQGSNPKNFLYFMFHVYFGF